MSEPTTTPDDDFWAEQRLRDALAAAEENDDPEVLFTLVRGLDADQRRLMVSADLANLLLDIAPDLVTADVLAAIVEKSPKTALKYPRMLREHGLLARAADLAPQQALLWDASELVADGLFADLARQYPAYALAGAITEVEAAGVFDELAVLAPQEAFAHPAQLADSGVLREVALAAPGTALAGHTALLRHRGLFTEVTQAHPDVALATCPALLAEDGVLPAFADQNPAAALQHAPRQLAELGLLFEYAQRDPAAAYRHADWLLSTAELIALAAIAPDEASLHARMVALEDSPSKTAAVTRHAYRTGHTPVAVTAADMSVESLFAPLPQADPAASPAGVVVPALAAQTRIVTVSADGPAPRSTGEAAPMNRADRRRVARQQRGKGRGGIND